jgi:hypothetical protein
MSAITGPQASIHSIRRASEIDLQEPRSIPAARAMNPAATADSEGL